MRITFCGISAPLLAAWGAELRACPELQAHCRCEAGDILALAVDAVDAYAVLGGQGGTLCGSHSLGPHDSGGHNHAASSHQHQYRHLPMGMHRFS